MAVPQGRCAGCGRTGKVKAVQGHIVDCEDWQELYRADRARALDPAAEFTRWETEDKQALKTAARATVVAGNIARRAAQAGRFARLPDPDLD